MSKEYDKLVLKVRKHAAWFGGADKSDIELIAAGQRQAVLTLIMMAILVAVNLGSVLDVLFDLMFSSSSKTEWGGFCVAAVGSAALILWVFEYRRYERCRCEFEMQAVETHHDKAKIVAEQVAASDR